MPVFIAAEAGINHLGDRTKMLALCDAAKSCGSDAIKFQAYNSEALVKRRGKGDLALLKQCELTDADLDAIAAHCKSIGLKWFASVFSPEQIERVLSRGACALKIGHAENEYYELQDACDSNKCGVPSWISNPKYLGYTPGSGVPKRVHCIAEYPATSPPRLHDVNRWFAAGFSSHYKNPEIPAAAALRGAEYIEFHLALSDADPEAAWSLMPDAAKKCCELIRLYESWM